MRLSPNTVCILSFLFLHTIPIISYFGLVPQDTIDRNLQDRVRQLSLYEQEAANTEVVRSPDETPIDPLSSAAILEKSLKKRPEKDELVERNILKGAQRLMKSQYCRWEDVSGLQRVLVQIPKSLQVSRLLKKN